MRGVQTQLLEFKISDSSFRPKIAYTNDWIILLMIGKTRILGRILMLWQENVNNFSCVCQSDKKCELLQVSWTLNLITMISHGNKRSSVSLRVFICPQAIEKSL